MKTQFVTRALIVVGLFAIFAATQFATTAHAAEPSALVAGTNKDIQLDDEFERAIELAHEVATFRADDAPLTPEQKASQDAYAKSVRAVENIQARVDWPKAPAINHVYWNIDTTVSTTNPFSFTK